uniref:Methyl-CpG binding protein n=1 Tax=Phaseolus vulgaris TaxID=3885 RepID=D2DW72_PHAVU|nr:methyl-CpG binding protein [Phaseolus vulgaris]
MSCKEESEVEEEVTPLHVQREDIVNTVQSQSLSTPLHVGSSSHFKLPHGWIVEEKPRRSNPTHLDRVIFSFLSINYCFFIHSCMHNVSLSSSSSSSRVTVMFYSLGGISGFFDPRLWVNLRFYYYEPHTRRKFRSLLSVQRHLAKEAGDDDISEKMISKDIKTDTNSTESGEGQQLEENASTAITKWTVKSDTSEKKVRGTRSCRNRAYKPYSVEQDEIITPKSSKHSVESAAKKTNSEKNNRNPVHNLIGPPPDKVSWVLSGPEGFWNPFVDGLAVTEAERLKWSEAFVLSIRDDED